jgi:hypothetical protein
MLESATEIITNAIVALDKHRADADDDFESAHIEADKILCQLLRDLAPYLPISASLMPRLIERYNEVGKWYS